MKLKLVFFIHAHKCAGTSTIDLFHQHGYTMEGDYRRTNGNTKYFDALRKITSYIDFDRGYNKDRLDSYLLDVQNDGISFVATEWVVPKRENMPYGRSDYFFFTILRDPFERFLSAYYFDIERGYRVVPTMYDFRSGQIHREYNYYTMLLSSRLERDVSPVTEQDYEKALATLHSLDAVVIQEQLETFDLLKSASVDPAKVERKNSTKNTNKIYDEAFKEFFLKEAKYDYMLYEEAKKIAARQLREKNNKKFAKLFGKK